MAFSKYFVNGQTGLGEHWTQWFGDFFTNFVGNGFEITEDSGLDINVSAGRAYLEDEDGLMYQIVSGAVESLTMANNSTNYVYLHCDNGSSWLTTDTIGTIDDDAILLGIVTTVDGAITDISDERILTPLTPNLSHSNQALGASWVGGGTLKMSFNPSKDRKIFFKTVAIDVSSVNATNVKLYYNIGDTDVEVATLNSTGTKIYELNVTTDDPEIEPYILISFTQAGAHFYWSNLRMDYYMY